MTKNVQRFAHLRGVPVLAALVVLGYLLARSDFHLTVMTFCAIYGIAAVALSLAFGYAGLISLGSSAFFGVGAYAVAYMGQKLQLPALVALCAAGVVPGLAGYLLARPLLRLNSHYLAVATLAMAVVMYIVFGQAKAVTGGLDPGIMGLPALKIGPLELGGPKAMYWVCWAVLIAVCAVALNFVNSAAGRATRALRSSEVAASCLGVDTVRLRVSIFALSSALIGLAGGLYAYFMRSFNATAFEPSVSIDLLMMVLVGSVSTLWGAVAGAVVITILPNFLENFEHYKMLVYGLLMVIVMVFFPNGLVQHLADLVSRNRRGAAQ